MRDLHVGGTGARHSAAAATLVDAAADQAGDLEELYEDIFDKVRDLARTADDYVHDNPWAVVGLVGLIGLTAGFLLVRGARHE